MVECGMGGRRQLRSGLVWVYVGGLLFAAACGDDGGSPDANVDAPAILFDAQVTADAPVDAAVDGMVDAVVVDAGLCSAGPYPDISGDYDNSIAGMCGDFGMSFDQVIAATIGGLSCQYTFTSIGIKSNPDVNGDVVIDSSGNFTGAALQLGTTQYVCDGVWNAVTSVMTLTCTGAPGVCTVTMQNTAGS